MLSNALATLIVGCCLASLDLTGPSCQLSLAESPMTVHCRARYNATRYNCVLKTINHRDGGASVEELATREWNNIRQAWDGGVSHTVEPLGLYYGANQHTPQSFILMRYVIHAVTGHSLLFWDVPAWSCIDMLHWQKSEKLLCCKHGSMPAFIVTPFLGLLSTVTIPMHS